MFPAVTSLQKHGCNHYCTMRCRCSGAIFGGQSSHAASNKAMASCFLSGAAPCVSSAKLVRNAQRTTATASTSIRKDTVSNKIRYMCCQF
jgi:hypothetical protein